ACPAGAGLPRRAISVKRVASRIGGRGWDTSPQTGGAAPCNVPSEAAMNVARFTAMLPLLVCTAPAPGADTAPPRPACRLAHQLKKARAKIEHVVIIMQENRSFDHYFGTYPRADGIAMRHGEPTICVPDPATGGCARPFHDPNDQNLGGPHVASSATADIDAGKMDGFITTEEQSRAGTCAYMFSPLCALPNSPPDVMGYHDAREIPNYWAYARDFVLQDHMFEPNASWSLPEHLFMVSAWSAKCTVPDDPASCTNTLDDPPAPGPTTHY